MNQKISRGEKKGFFSGKGFYITLALSIIAVGGAAWIGINSSLNNLSDQNDKALPDTTPSQAVEQKEWDIPVKDKTPAPAPSAPAVTPEKPQAEDNTGAQGFILPISGDIISQYSGDKMVKSKTLDEWMMHTGIDIAAKAGTPVKAVSAGKVLEVKNDSLWGACVIVDHGNGIESHYYNLKSAVSVKNGQQVKLGDTIGTVGNTADIERAEDSHLHFAMKKDGNWVDPSTIVK